MNENLLLGTIFITLWVITFVPAWWLLLKLLALSASPQGLTAGFWGLLFVYRLIIVLPYLALLLLGRDVIPQIFQVIIVGFVAFGAFFSIIRFAFKDKIVSSLWWVYGFVYDGLLHYAPYRRLTRQVVERAFRLKPDAKSVLELGCGTGNVLSLLKQTFIDAEITGVDNSRSMLRIARKKHPALHLYRKDVVHFMEHAQASSYDVVVLQNVLYALEDRARFWTELERILHEDGAAVITNSDRAGSGTITKEHLRYGKWYELLYPKLIMVGIIDALISQLSKGGSFHFLQEQQIREEVAGRFEISDVQRAYGDVNILFTLRKTKP